MPRKGEGEPTPCSREIGKLGYRDPRAVTAYQVFVGKFGFAEEIELGSGLRKASEAR